jgi:DNA-binding protein Fis
MEEQMTKPSKPEQNITSDVKKDEPEWVIPPGLNAYIPMFEAHYRSTERNPIIVVGPTGVGKKLFLKIFEKLFLEENKNAPVIWANCPSFGGDLNMCRSELFGHKRGSFTGALGENEGYIKQADGGALVLEEIGELHPQAQALLLDFIDTGIFYRVGDPKPQPASVQIIGSTNNEENLRPDFRFRCYPFYVPPVCQRRDDVLHYIHFKFPDLLESLTRSEALSLLAYHWPGNVREIYRVCRLIKRGKSISGFSPLYFSGVEGKLFGETLWKLRSLETGLNTSLLVSLNDKLQKGGVDVKSLESILNIFGVGLTSSDRAFPDLLKYSDPQYRDNLNDLMDSIDDDTLKKLAPNWSHCTEDHEKRFNIKASGAVNPFLEAGVGYTIFCSLFFQDQHRNENNFLIDKCTSISGSISWPELIKAKFRGHYMKLLEQIFQFLSGIDAKIPDDPKSLENFFVDLLHKFPSNPFLAPLKEYYPIEENKGEVDIFSMKFNEFEKFYYSEVIQRARGDKAEAARRIGVNYQTFMSRLRRVLKDDYPKD